MYVFFKYDSELNSVSVRRVNPDTGEEHEDVFNFTSTMDLHLILDVSSDNPKGMRIRAFRDDNAPWKMHFVPDCVAYDKFTFPDCTFLYKEDEDRLLFAFAIAEEFDTVEVLDRSQVGTTKGWMYLEELGRIAAAAEKAMADLNVITEDWKIEEELDLDALNLMGINLFQRY